MTDLRQAAQQALEALESLQGGCTDHDDGTVEAITVWCPEVIDALRTALEQQQAEPVSELQKRYLESEKAFQQQAEPMSWTPVAEALPKSGVKVLACYRNRLGNLRRIRAMWTAAKTEEADSDDAEACSEYDEATDTHYVTEGWYECIDNWGEYSSVAVTEGEVTHWMPLPPDPYTTPPQQQAELVAWSYDISTTMMDHGYDGWEHRITRYKPNVPEGSIRSLTPLYTTLPQRQWVGLTDEDCARMSAGDKLVAMWAEAKLKERNNDLHKD